MSSRRFREYDLDQGLLLPPSLEDWLPDGHLAFFISDVVDGLDVSRMLADYESPDGKGAPPYHPRMLLKVLIYGYATGSFSSRKLAAKCIDDVGFRYLAAQQMPDFRTFIKFRSRHLEFFRDVFVQVVEFARESGLVKMGHLSIDGTKVKANASKHKAMSYGHMLAQERKLKDEIEGLLQRAQALDEREDEEYGDDDGHSLPKELRRREDRLRVIREAKQRIEERAQVRAEEEEQRREKEAEERKSRGEKPKRYRKVPERKPKAKEQENFTDRDSRIMRDGATKGYVQGYNAQVGVDSAHQIIVAAEVGNNAADVGRLLPVLDAAAQNTGEWPGVLSADSGYKSEENFAGLAERSVDGYSACGREVYDRRVRCPRGRTPQGATLTDRMARKLLTKRGRAVYRKRKHLSEPVIGWIKSVIGFRQFGLRGQAKVAGEWMLVCLAVNLRRMGQVGSPA
jgi:transposase